MKRLFFIVSILAISITGFSQINVATNGNVGIKTTTPANDFTVKGMVSIDAKSTPAGGSAIRTYVSNETANAYYLNNSAYNGDVFWVVGEGRVVCRLGLYQTSDINAKEDVKDIESPMALINNLHGVKYKYKEPNRATTEKDERIGLIAQEVEEVVPQAVTTLDDGTKAVSYTDLIGILIEAMKEQQTQIEDLKKQITQLEDASKK